MGGVEEFARMFPVGTGPNTMTVDGTLIWSDRPAGRDGRQAACPGRTEAAMSSTVRPATPGRPVIWTGSTSGGRTHRDTAAARGFLPEPGGSAVWRVPNSAIPVDNTDRTRLPVDAGSPGYGKTFRAPARSFRQKSPPGAGPPKGERRSTWGRARGAYERGIPGAARRSGGAPRACGGATGDFDAGSDIACGPANPGKMTRTGTPGWRTRRLFPDAA